MATRNCKYCGKELPVGATDDKCSLCAIGLIPTDAAVSAPREKQDSHIVEGRTLSGVHCPGCHAEFSLADVSNCRCSICGAQFSEDRMDQMVRRVRGANRQMPEMALKPTGIGHQSWPDDAPIW